jgi:hypothetical protein
MSKEIVIQPQPRAWLQESFIEPYVSRYEAYLSRGRYATNTQRVYLCCVAHFAHWLGEERYGLTRSARQLSPASCQSMCRLVLAPIRSADRVMSYERHSPGYWSCCGSKAWERWIRPRILSRTSS